MEKRVILTLVLIILVNFFIISVCSQEEEKDANLPADIGKGIENITEGIEGVKGIKEKTDTVLEQDIIVPENLQIFARIIFGVQGEIPLQIFIILVGIWIVLFILIASILKLTPFFEGFKAWIGGAVITCLIAITGTIRSLAIFSFNFGNFFGFLEKWSVLKIVVALVIVGILFYGASIILKLINKSSMLNKAEMAGVKAGAGVKMMKETFEEGTGS